MEDTSWTLPQEWDRHLSLLIFFSGTSKFLHTLCEGFSTCYEELGSVWVCSVQNEYSLSFPGLNNLLANCLRWWDLGEFLPGPLQPYFAKQGKQSLMWKRWPITASSYDHSSVTGQGRATGMKLWEKQKKLENSRHIFQDSLWGLEGEQ